MRELVFRLQRVHAAFGAEAGRARLRAWHPKRHSRVNHQCIPTQNTDSASLFLAIGVSHTTGQQRRKNCDPLAKQARRLRMHAPSMSSLRFTNDGLFKNR